MMITPEDIGGEIAGVVSRVRRNFGWYDEFARACGYDEEARFERLPLIDEAILNRHYYNTAYPQFDDCMAYHTSGTSTGERKRILYSAEDHARYVEQRSQIFGRFVSAECRLACSDLGTGHAAASAAEIFGRLGLETFDIDFRRPVREHVELLNARRPDVLFTMPVILDNIVRTGALKHRPKKIIVVGDVATASWKSYIADHFALRRSDLLDIVGSIEIGAIAHECFDCGLYHLGAHLFAETVSPSDLFGDAGYRGSARIIVLTSTTRTVFPAIRFVTGDLVEGFTRQRCGGETVYAFEKITGRVGSEMKNGEKISIYDICEAVNRYVPGGLFEAYQDPGKLVIRICSPDFTRDKAEQIKAFIKESNPAVRQMIESELVGDIEVCGVGAGELSPGAAKKIFRVKG